MNGLLAANSTVILFEKVSVYKLITFFYEFRNKYFVHDEFKQNELYRSITSIFGFR